MRESTVKPHRRHPPKPGADRDAPRVGGRVGHEGIVANRSRARELHESRCRFLRRDLCLELGAVVARVAAASPAIRIERISLRRGRVRARAVVTRGDPCLLRPSWRLHMGPSMPAVANRLVVVRTGIRGSSGLDAVGTRDSCSAWSRYPAVADSGTYPDGHRAIRPRRRHRRSTRRRVRLARLCPARAVCRDGLAPGECDHRRDLECVAPTRSSSCQARRKAIFRSYPSFSAPSASRWSSRVYQSART